MLQLNFAFRLLTEEVAYCLVAPIKNILPKQFTVAFAAGQNSVSSPLDQPDAPVASCHICGLSPWFLKP